MTTIYLGTFLSAIYLLCAQGSPSFYYRTSTFHGIPRTTNDRLYHQEAVPHYANPAFIQLPRSVHRFPITYTPVLTVPVTPLSQYEGQIQPYPSRRLLPNYSAHRQFNKFTLRNRQIPENNFFAYLTQNNEAKTRSTEYQQSRQQNIFSNPAEVENIGFGYNTQYDDGARSSVIFLRGPKTQQIKNFNVFSFNNANQKARTQASDSVDTNASHETNNPSGFEILQAFLQNPQATIQNFYSYNDQLFSKVPKQTFPASTFPSTNAVPVETSSRFNNKKTITTEIEKAAPKEKEVAESILINTLLRPNVLIEEDLKFATSTAAPTEAPTTQIKESSTESSEESTEDSTYGVTKETDENVETTTFSTNSISTENTEPTTEQETTTYYETTTFN